jgi:hypothetical protein
LRFSARELATDDRASVSGKLVDAADKLAEDATVPVYHTGTSNRARTLFAKVLRGLRQARLHRPAKANLNSKA